MVRKSVFVPGSQQHLLRGSPRRNDPPRNHPGGHRWGLVVLALTASALGFSIVAGESAAESDARTAPAAAAVP